MSNNSKLTLKLNSNSILKAKKYITERSISLSDDYKTDYENYLRQKYD